MEKKFSDYYDTDAFKKFIFSNDVFMPDCDETSLSVLYNLASSYLSDMLEKVRQTEIIEYKLEVESSVITQQRLDEVKKKTKDILSNYQVIKAGLFGSILTKEYTSESDIDIVIKVDKPKSIDFSDTISLLTELEDVLGRKVDLVYFDALVPALKPYILPTIKYFYIRKN